MPNDHERRGDAGGGYQRMEVGDRVACSDRHRDRVAAAGRLADRNSWPVIGTDSREAGNLGEDVRLARLGLGPVIGGRLQAWDDNDGLN